MTIQEAEAFCRVNAIDFSWEEDAAYFHWNNPMDEKDEQVLRVEYKKLEELDGPKLKQLIINGRDVLHVTRVVGYFSATRNWNKSKIGELGDRHKGNYGITNSETHEIGKGMGVNG